MTPEISNERIRAIFLACGFEIKPGRTDLKPYVYAAARQLLAETATPVKTATSPLTGEEFGTGTTEEWFSACFPTPTVKQLHVQLGVHLEEVAETLDALSFKGTADVQRMSLSDALSGMATSLKTGQVEIDKEGTDWKEVGDGLSDTRVTSLGALHCIGAEVGGIVKEVDDSNFSKFLHDRPIYDENGKVGKGPNTFRPDIMRFIPPFPPAFEGIGQK